MTSGDGNEDRGRESTGGLHKSLTCDLDFRVNSKVDENLHTPLSFPPNPLSGSNPTLSAIRVPTPPEDPVWSGWDVVGVVALTVVSLMVIPLLVVLPAHLFLYPKLSLMDIVKIPDVILLVQVLAYGAVFGFIYSLLKKRGGAFWAPLRWNWPTRTWGAYLMLGALLYLALMGFSALLPIPKHLPIDRFFQNARAAALMTSLSVTLAPFMEELFFRGLLYPVLARRMGVPLAIFLTGAAFGLLHGDQLNFSWAVLIIFLVGVALTAVRAVTKSVAASFLVHVGYNGTLSTLLVVATDGFRHLEKLNS